MVVGTGLLRVGVDVGNGLLSVSAGVSVRACVGFGVGVGVGVRFGVGVGARSPTPLAISPGARARGTMPGDIRAGRVGPRPRACWCCGAMSLGTGGDAAVTACASPPLETLVVGRSSQG